VPGELKSLPPATGSDPGPVRLVLKGLRTAVVSLVI
jgi:hypothetical protein